jgi:hypothetical protein
VVSDSPPVLLAELPVPITTVHQPPGVPSELLGGVQRGRKGLAEEEETPVNVRREEVGTLGTLLVKDA